MINEYDDVDNNNLLVFDVICNVIVLFVYRDVMILDVVEIDS